MYEAHRRFVDSLHRHRHDFKFIQSPKDRIAQHIYVDLINNVICELEHVIKLIVRNIKRKLNTYNDHTILKKIVKLNRSRAITEIMIIDLKIYLCYRFWMY